MSRNAKLDLYNAVKSALEEVEEITVSVYKFKANIAEKQLVLNASHRYAKYV